MHIGTVATVALACIIATTTAAPTLENLTVDLAGAEKRSVCPIKAYTDHDADRIPSRIKMLACKHEPNPMCNKQEATHACCVKHHHSYTMQCMNVTDYVPVRFHSSGLQLKMQRVLVGCSCQMDPVVPILEGQ